MAADATFRIYENIGYGSAELVASPTATFRTYENVGYAIDATLDRSALAEAYVNTGLEPIPVPSLATFVAYENTGVIPGTRLTVVRGPRGWGVIPAGPQTVTLLDESSAGTAEAYENIS